MLPSKKFPLYIVSFVILLLAFDATAQTVSVVYFIPFEVQTYTPVTEADIMFRAWEKWTFSSQQQRRHLIEILNHGKEKTFDHRNVRGAVYMGHQIYFIDSTGVVLREGLPSILINKNDFYRLRGMLGTGELKLFKR